MSTSPLRRPLRRPLSTHQGAPRAAVALAVTLAIGSTAFGAWHIGKPAAAPALRAAAQPVLPAQDVTPTAIPPAPSDLPGLIAYTRRADSDYVWEVFQSRADGSADRPITHHALAGKGADAPRWSPDGSWTVYATTDKAGQVVTLWRIGFEGGTPAALATVRSAQAGSASIGPDDDRIVFVGAALAGPSSTDLLVKGSGQEAAAFVATSDREEDMPDWSAANNRVIFSARDIAGPAAGRAWDLYAVDGDGGNEMLVVGREGVSECSPRWSPDGRKVAYLAISGQSCFGAGTLWVRDMDSGDEQPVVGGASIQAAWSPDGRWLLAYNTYNGGLYAPGGPTPAPQSRLQLKGLYAIRLADGAIFRLGGAAGGGQAKEGSYLWGQVADWTAGTYTPTPPASPTSSVTATLEVSPTATASDTPNPTATTTYTAVPVASDTASPGPTGSGKRVFLPLTIKEWLLYPGGNKRRP